MSRYGTFLNKRRVPPEAETLLEDQDVITLGDGDTRMDISFEASGMSINEPETPRVVKNGGGKRVISRGPGKGGNGPAGPSQIEVLRARRNNMENADGASGGAGAGAGAGAGDGPSGTVVVDAAEYEKLKKDNASIYKQFLEMEKQVKEVSKEKSELQAAVALHGISLVATNTDDATTKDMFHAMIENSIAYLAEKNPKSAAGVVDALAHQCTEFYRENNTSALAHTLETLMALKARGVPGYDASFVSGGGIEHLLAVLTDDQMLLELHVLGAHLLSIMSTSIKALQRVRAWTSLPAFRELYQDTSGSASSSNDTPTGPTGDAEVVSILAPVFEKVDNGPRDEISEYLETEFAKIVGLNQVKDQMRRMLKAIRLNERRRLAGVTVSAKQDHHMVLVGAPGTGKTSIARVLHAMLLKMGQLKKDVFIEVSREDLVAGYIGQTAIQTKAVIQKAAGGILFIDEAYRLSSGGKKDFGKEAIETLMTEMTRQCPGDDRIIFIFAGYAEEMSEFKAVNPGLSRRISYTFDFANYTVDELVQISIQKVAAKNFKLAPGVETQLAPIIESQFSVEERGKHNGGLAARLVDAAIENLNMRLDVDAGSIDTLVTLTLSDFAEGAVKLKESWWG